MITFAQYVRVMRAEDEWERMRLLAAFALNCDPEQVDEMHPQRVFEAVRIASAEIAPPDPTTTTSGPSAGSPSCSDAPRQR